MNIDIACGGTGGHIFPGVATATVLRERGHKVTLWLAGRDIETLSVEGWEGDTVAIRAAGFPSGFSIRGLGAAVRLCGAIAASWRIMKRTRPDVVLGMGSYASVGPALAARCHGVPVVLHEANAVPGRAIAFLARFATCIAVAFEDAAESLDKANVRVTGFPLRRELRPMPKPANKGFGLLVMGGSQGAHALNTIVPDAVAKLRQNDIAVQVTHLTGMREAEAVAKRYQDCGIAADVHAFMSDMAACYATADFAIARAGAATCTELAVCGVPALLVPLPTAPRNHQTLNAMAMAKHGGMAMQPQSELTSEWLSRYLKDIVENPDRRTAMQAQLQHADIAPDGAARLADVVEEAGA